MKVENLTVYFSIITSSIVVFGLTYNIYLYNKFNIEITSYIDLGESLLLFLPSLLGIFIVIIPSILGINTLLPSSIKNEPIEKHFLYGQLFDGSLQNRKVVIWVFLIFLLISLTLLILSDYDYKLGSAAYGTFLGYTILFFPLVLRLFYDYCLKYKINIPIFTPIVFYILLFILISTLYAAERRYVRVLQGIKNPKAKVILDNSKLIETDSILRYIGKTKDYMFLYDRRSKNSIIIPLSEVKEIRFTRNW